MTKTPLRVSFLGGGTDYIPFSSKNTGYVLASTINKFVYVNILKLPEYANEKYRFTYRITESVEKIEKMKHPSLRETLKLLNWDVPLNIATMADVPGGSGLGRISDFLVGLLKSLSQFKKLDFTEVEAAKLAVEIEREILNEPGGLQDQWEVSIGGFRLYEFNNKEVNVSNQLLSCEEMGEFSKYFTLVYVPGERNGNFHAKNTSISTEKTHQDRLKKLSKLTKEVYLAFNGEKNLESKYKILSNGINAGWEIKQNFSEAIESKAVKKATKLAFKNGADCVKLCGAGGSGFLLIGHKPEDRNRVVNSFPIGFSHPISFTCKGSEIIVDAR